MPSAWIDRRGDRWVVRYRTGGRESPKFYGGIFKRKADAVARRRVIEHELACLRVPDIRTLAAEKAKKTLTLGVDEPELAKRRAAWKAPPPRVERGVLAKYARCVRSASEGAVTS